MVEYSNQFAQILEDLPLTPYEKKPKIHLFHPDWWHGHGIKMSLRTLELTPPKLVISGSAADLTIFDHEYKDLWAVNWEVRQSQAEKVVGRVLMTNNQLLAAFDHSNELDNYSEWLIDRYGATCASQSNFIRFRRFLNIPGPGTGHDGDPNISIELDEDIKKAVLKLMAARI